MNTLWLLNIDSIIKEKWLQVQLVKVKGHSGNRLNNCVDELANEKRDSSK